MTGRSDVDRFVEMLSRLVVLKPSASNPDGRRAVRAELTDWLRALGFTVRELGEDAASRLVVATRPGAGVRLGMCGHYDVEEAGDGWNTAAFSVTRIGDRLYGRGVADNLGPLVLRLLIVEQLSGPTPPLLFVLQGEEEIGSPVAHAILPTLALPEVAMWIEETGYFEREGGQRLLTKDLDAVSESIVAAAIAAAAHAGRAVSRHARYLNKAFGEARCPFLSHVVGGRPYLAIGPNDPDSRIHGPNESLSLENIPLAMRQFEALLRSAAEVC